MESLDKKQTRIRFIGIGVTAAAALTVFRFFIPSKKEQTRTVKMLTQDGKLVEVEVEKIAAQRGKITDKQLKNWVIKK